MTEDNRRRVVRTNIQLVWLMVPLLALQGGMLGVLGLLSSTSSARGGLPAGSILGMGAIAVVIILVILYAHLAIPAMAARQRIVFGDGTYTFTGWFRTVRLRTEASRSSPCSGPSAPHSCAPSTPASCRGGRRAPSPSPPSWPPGSSSWQWEPRSPS